MNKALKHFLLCFGLIAGFCDISLADLKDYSNIGEEYRVLKNIRFNALNITFAEKRKVIVLGEVFEGFVFKVKTREVAGAVDGPSHQYANVHTDLDIVYEVVVGLDIERKIHDQLIDEIHSLALNPSSGGKEFKEIGLLQYAGPYLLYKGQAKLPDLVWFDGRFVQISFKYFDSKIRRKDRAETTETFWQDKIRFYSGEKKLRVEAVKEGFREQFLKLYDEGKFRKP